MYILIHQHQVTQAYFKDKRQGSEPVSFTDLTKKHTFNITKVLKMNKHKRKYLLGLKMGLLI